jgi:hypothetical protein
MRNQMKFITMGMTVLLLAFATAGVPAFAQRGQMQGAPDETGVGPGPDRGGPKSEEKREEIRKKVEAVKIWRLTEALKLDEKTSAKFLPLVSSIERKRRDLMRERVGGMRELRISLESKNPDEKKLRTTLELLNKNHHEMMKLHEKEIEAARDYLTVEQQARYLIFQHEFQNEMHGMIAGARGQGRGGKGMRGGLNRPAGPMGEGTDKEAPPSSPQGER